MGQETHTVQIMDHPAGSAAAMLTITFEGPVTFLPLVYLADQQTPVQSGRADIMEGVSFLPPSGRREPTSTKGCFNYRQTSRTIYGGG